MTRNRVQSNQSGFGLLPVLLVVIFLVVAVIAGLVVYNHDTSSDTNVSNNQAASTEPANEATARAIAKAYTDFIQAYKQPPAYVLHSLHSSGIYLSSSASDGSGSQVMIQGSTYSSYSVAIFTYGNVPKLYADSFYLVEHAKCVNRDSVALSNASTTEGVVLYTVPSGSSNVVRCLDT